MVNKRIIALVIILFLSLPFGIHFLKPSENVSDTPEKNKYELTLKNVIVNIYPEGSQDTEFWEGSTIKSSFIRYNGSVVFAEDVAYEREGNNSTIFISSPMVSYIIENKLTNFMHLKLIDIKRDISITGESGKIENKNTIYLNSVSASIGKNQIYGTGGNFNMESGILNLDNPRVVIEFDEIRTRHSKWEKLHSGGENAH